MNDAEKDIQAPLARILERRLSGFRALKECARLSGGASQQTFRLKVETDAGERALVLRRVPPGLAQLSHQAGVAVEAELIIKARANGVPEPEVIYILEDPDGLGEGFIMTFVAGETLGNRIVRDDSFAAVRPRLARQCGEILARIHKIELDEALSRKLRRKTAQEIVQETWKAYQDFSVPQPMIDYTARWLLENLPEAAEPILVHSDFRNGNLIITPEEGIVAVLDWELSHLGDPMRDLGWLCTNSWRFGRSDLPVGGFGKQEELFAAYEEASGKKVDLARVKFWTVYGSFYWAMAALGMADLYRNGPDKTLDKPVIGRRSSEAQIDCVNLIIPGPVGAPTEMIPENLDLPRTDELLQSVGNYLRQDVVPHTEGRLNFLSRVGSNAVDILLREMRMGPAYREAECDGLRRLLGRSGETLEALRWALVQALRDGSMPLDASGLAAHLRQMTAYRVAIDQPKYSGYAQAMQAGETSRA
jgi:aminoglycoside phosphotransferase (APT) family kinase protein